MREEMRSFASFTMDLLLYSQLTFVVQVEAGTYIKFRFRFAQSSYIGTIHKEHNAIDGREVVFPHSSGCMNKQNTNILSFTLQSVIQ